MFNIFKGKKKTVSKDFNKKVIESGKKKIQILLFI